MASRRGANEFSSSSSSSIDDDEAKHSKIPDVSTTMDQFRDNNSRISDESRLPTGGDLPRREENPFSFKHFLSKDAPTNYNSAGARPKVYSSTRKTPEKVGNETDSLYSRNPTELPDFVQDHLVIEQCYMNNHETGSSSSSSIVGKDLGGAGAIDPPPPLLLDMDNLPDFTLTGLEQSENNPSNIGGDWRRRKDVCQGSSSAAGDLPFDLTGGLFRNKRGKHSTIAKGNDDSLDLYSCCVDGANDGMPIRLQSPAARISQVEGFPFDLPPAATLEATISNQDDPTTGGPTNSPANEPTVNKSLPDFLNDGPIRNRVATPSAGESTSSLENFATEHSDQSLLLENERLRDELKIARRQIAEGTRMIESLKAELISRRQVDHEETAHLEKAIQQVEVNLKQSTKRATSAENAVTSLKQQVKALTAEVAMLRTENQRLSDSTGAAGCTAEYQTPATERRIKKLSDELRSAATSAELSLRQLMSGVSNLKVLASALENVDRIEDRTKDFLPDYEEEEDNAAGPAL